MKKLLKESEKVLFFGCTFLLFVASCLSIVFATKNKFEEKNTNENVELVSENNTVNNSSSLDNKDTQMKINENLVKLSNTKNNYIEPEGYVLGATTARQNTIKIKTYARGDNTDTLGTIEIEVPKKWIKLSDLIKNANTNIYIGYYLIIDKVDFSAYNGFYGDVNDWYVIYNEEKNTILFNDQFVPDENTSLDAGWAPAIYEGNKLYPTDYFYLYYGKIGGTYNYLTFDYQIDGTGDFSLYSIKTNSTFNQATSPYNRPDAEDYNNDYRTFKGWYTEDGTQFDFDTAITQDYNLHAEWYYKTKINFNTNGGTGSIDSITKELDTLLEDENAIRTIKLPDIGDIEGPIDSRTGKVSTFLGWSENNEGRSKIYKAGEEYTIPQYGEKNLYAIWSNNYIDTLYLKAKFKYYNTHDKRNATETSEIVVEVPKEWTKLSDLDDYIDYSSIKVLVPNGYINGVQQYKTMTGDDFRLSSIDMTNPGASLDWYIIMNTEKGVPYIHDDQSYVPDDKTSQNSGWYDENFTWPYSYIEFVFEEKKDNRVTFNPNGGTFIDGVTDEKVLKVNLDGSTNVVFPKLQENENIKFDGWYTADGKRYTEEDVAGIYKDITLIAHWTSSYNISFDSNGALNPDATPKGFNNLKSGDTITLPDGKDLKGPLDNFTHKNATFIGWSESELGNAGDKEVIKNKVYPPGSEYQLTYSHGNGEIKLYAIWSAYDYDHDEIYFTIKIDGVIPEDEPASQQQGTDVYEYIKVKDENIGWNNMGFGYASNILKEKKLVVHDYESLDNSNILANLNEANIPSDEDIKRYIPDFDPSIQEVYWYVIKLEDNLPETPGWHVDGVIRYKSRFNVIFKTGTSEIVTNMPGNQSRLDESTIVKIPDIIPEREGYKFAGWKIEGVTINADNTFKMPAYDVVLIAKWEKINENGEKEDNSSSSNIKNPNTSNKLGIIASITLLMSIALIICLKIFNKKINKYVSGKI